MSGGFTTDGQARRHFGLYPALVTDIVDTENLGRVEVKFPWLGGEGDAVRAWATLLTPYADDDQGFLVLPAVGTQVVVGFEAGDLARPYVVGSAWNGKESLPESPAAANNKRLIKTRTGSLLEFDDTDGAAKVTLSMKSGHKLVMQESPAEVQLMHSNGCQLKLDSSGNVTLTATSGVTVNATSMTVNCPSTTFSGSITCGGSVTTPAITAAVYSPGAGNIW